VDDLIDAIEDVLGLDDGDDGAAGDGGSLFYTVDDGGASGDGALFDTAGGGGSLFGVSSTPTDWYGPSAYEVTSEALAQQHAINLEVIDNIDGVDDYEYEVVEYP
jgi:hypothetical protein